MHDNRQTIAEGPDFVTIFDHTDAGLGAKVMRLLVTCAADSVNPIEYRLADASGIAAATGKVARLQPGEAIALGPFPTGIGQVDARGVGGAGTGGYEVMAL